MATNRTILVTGGLGLIGHNVVSKLEQQGHRVIITDIRTNYGISPQGELDYLILDLPPGTGDVQLRRVRRNRGIGCFTRRVG